ncbi:GNAT family N-acetyltransferase [Herbiconiux sp. KACC 21604]|uniref:GNAT family N-acetyltransferase n=1 Tax=unclassified Herbiconiux TaxID=2618217 RepID=UPI0014927665|nr:GNAT family N-acetyltransferase [Herbiconiux sp. SALV-R1]QJU53153.1 GNAT family N-acetyltransferase [Herbiconiux sp. SALV-R1]WPO88096.1 GNAT family N-acetyltransferase [Herbiconiux sp. KACC 21604]
MTPRTAAEPELRTFPAAVDAEGHADAATREWIKAEAQGFHEPRLTDAVVDRRARHLVADAQRLTGVYQDSGSPAGYGPEVPVATFASLDGELSTGGGEPVRANLISAVTVRPTHRRRGLLRRMMVADLERAVADGHMLAALTVSEATIYRRFGFGVATAVNAVTVTTDSRFRLTTSPAGRCELVDAGALKELGPAVFARFHAGRPGSIGRLSRHWSVTSGLEGDDRDDAPEVRAAVHLDDTDTIDGYVSYRFKGWDTTPHTIEIVDLVAATDEAYLGLWEFLGSLDLVERVTWEAAPADDPLRWALADWRVVKATGVDDWLWVRVLDAARAFEARAYVPDASGEVTIDVTDALGHADGRLTLRVEGGTGTAEFTPRGTGPAGVDAAAPGDGAGADLALDVADLGSLYLGGVDPRVLTAAGRLRELTPGAAQRARTLLAPLAPVWGTTHF